MKNLAGELPEIIGTLLHVLSAFCGATICCAHGQYVYVEKRGANPPKNSQTCPANPIMDIEDQLDTQRISFS
jgi:hypothetical protein